jgi:PAS domain S-box-containing protein
VLVPSEFSFAGIFENTAEAILVAEVRTGNLRWANPAACRLLGYTRTEILELTTRDIHPARDLPSALDLVLPLAGRLAVTKAVRCVRKDGTTVVVDIRGSAVLVEGVAATVDFLTDITEQVAAGEERARLVENILRSERSLAEAQRVAHIGSWEWDLLTGTVERSAELHRIYGYEPGTIPATTDGFYAFVHPDDRARVQRYSEEGRTAIVEQVVEYRGIRPDGSVRVVRDKAEVIRDPGGAPIRMVGTTEDVTEERALAVERERLVAAVEHTSDAVLIADLSGAIKYVNAAFEQASGYRRTEVIGQTPSTFSGGAQPAAFYRMISRRLARGQSWSGTLINRRKNGSVYETDGTISPIRGGEGELSGFVSVERDVTALRAAESGLARALREHGEVAAALARLQPGAGAEETAAAICDELIGLAGIDLVAVISFLDEDRAIPLASCGTEDVPFTTGKLLPATSANALYERATLGPWAELFASRSPDGRYSLSAYGVGMRAMSYAPIRNGDVLLGVVAAGTNDDASAVHPIDHLPAVIGFAAAASALLGATLEEGHRKDMILKRTRHALATGGLLPVFQPIVALASGSIVGYEALTRFADGTRPDHMIADAHSIALGVELESACIAAALQAADTLPPGAWLSLNVSPGVILDPVALPQLLARQSRMVVLEVTEHAKIADYETIRAAVGRLGPAVRLSVDDAGAGFASLRHVVELAPQFLKLDIGLVRHVDRDLTRQAMVAGLSHFAVKAGCDVIAEGVETSAELETLRELGVTLGQGYLLGRPDPPPKASARKSRPPRTSRPTSRRSAAKG